MAFLLSFFIEIMQIFRETAVVLVRKNKYKLLFK